MKITVISSKQPATLTKHIQSGSDGRLAKTSSAHLSEGGSEVIELGSMAALNTALDSLQPHQAVAYGVTSAAVSRIVSAKLLPENPGAITRSDKHFGWPRGAGVLYLDYDPAEVALSRDGVLGSLFATVPQLASAPWLWRPSASGCIYNAETGEELEGLRGQHVYIGVKDASDIPRAGLALFKRLWLAGHGRVEIAANGAQLVRGLVDQSVWQPSRLDFASGATTGPGLVRRPPPGMFVEGALLDTRAALPDLTDAEESRFKALVNEAKNDGATAAHQQRERHVETVAREQGVSAEEVRARYEVAEANGVLGNDFMIELAYDGGTVSVADILLDPARYHGKICLDPLEPDYNNRHPVGKIFNDSKGAYVDSKAHGGRVFILGCIAALLFKKEASDGVSFKGLIAEIRSTACDLALLPELIGKIASGPYGPTERVLLKAQVESELKADKLLTPEVKALLQGVDAKPSAPAARDVIPHAGGATLPPYMPMHPSAWATYHTKGKDEKPMGTVDNFGIMLESYGIGISFNEVAKDTIITIPGAKTGGALYSESAVSHLLHLSNLNHYPKGDVMDMIPAIARRNVFNPVADYVNATAWDGRDHLSELFDQITLSDDEDPRLARILLERWMLGALAVGMGITDGMEFVLTLVDEQGGAGKTRFFRSLAPAHLIKDSVTLDAKDKDSVKTAISYWLVELGELDGTFSRSESNAIKAFLSASEDEMRMPYARVHSKFPRRTAYMASVNTTNFLVDGSGNRRFWPIRVKAINHEHSVDMAQVWAQVLVSLKAGHTWHLSQEENAFCAERNEDFRAHSRVDDVLAASLLNNSSVYEHMSTSEILQRSGMPNANKSDLNEAARWLRRHGFEDRKRQGKRGFIVPDPSIAAAVFKPQLEAIK